MSVKVLTLSVIVCCFVLVMFVQLSPTTPSSLEQTKKSHEQLVDWMLDKKGSSSSSNNDDEGGATTPPVPRLTVNKNKRTTAAPPPQTTTSSTDTTDQRTSSSEEKPVEKEANKTVRKLPATNVLFGPCRDVGRQQEYLRHLPNISALPGFEIGGSFQPMFTKAQAPYCYTIDHDTKENLIAKFKKMGVPHFRNMVPVDIVWQGKHLKEEILNATGGKKLSYGISSHVLEHMTDLIGFLNDIADVTTDDAVFVNSIPDKRKTFDYALPLKTYDSMIEDHKAKRGHHSEKVIRGWYQGTRHITNKRRKHTDAEADDAIARHRNGTYVDVHNLPTSPVHFLALMTRLIENGLLKWKIGYFQASVRHEFYIVFSKKPVAMYDDLNPDALEQVAKIENSNPGLFAHCMTKQFFNWARNN